MLRITVVLLLSFTVYARKDNVICPDGRSMCFDTETCCVMVSGNYGCCPFSAAVCCSDKVHCCPSGYKCNLQTVTCDRNGRKIPMLEQKAGRPVKESSGVMTKGVNNVMCPDGSSYCNDGNTCCKAKDGGYACCPLPEASCCSDHVHCCPSGYTCDLSAGGCTRGSHFVMMSKKTSAQVIAPAKETSCPQGQDYCNKGETCCPTHGGEYGCCPMADAVCCPDKEHCCPHGFKCDDHESRCTSNGISVPYLTKIKKKTSNAKFLQQPLPVISGKRIKSVFCPDHFSHCPTGFTCCKSLFGFWECCPLANATCCDDHKHCCPQGTVCDLEKKSCKPKSELGVSVPWMTKKKAIKIRKDAVTCPDMKTYCPTGYTCCLLSSGMYGCCPYPNAVCCSDHTHCCPSGTTCDVAHGACLSQDVVPLQILETKKPVIDLQPNDIIVCPDRKSFCHAEHTCCQTKDGKYACCPFKRAVCCDDKEHCCPNGMMCDIKEGKCIRGAYVSPMKKKTLAKNTENSFDTTCPDHTSCPSGHTCCKLAGGGYGCCPFSDAVCCSDGKHCCPHGTTCDLSSGTCMRGTGVNAVTVMLAKVKKTMVTCPDHSSCPSGHTCCKLAGGGYGCCPFPEAVCCSDGKHCCPHGTTCDLSSGTCMRGTGNNAVTVMLAKVKKTMVTCPGGSSCPGKETCCKLAGGGYGCCPFPEAVCCSDGKHCCPHGTSCDLSSGTCMRGTGNNAMTVMLAEVKKSMVTCPDHSSCPSGHTCCKLAGGGYGCCPFPEAVCCSDGKHCCPHGTTCDLSSGTCMRGTGVNAVTVMLAKVKKTMVTCPDHSSCPSGHTCCKLAGGGYGCCPFPEAVCCSDGKHCCPHGTTCDLSSGTCVRGTGNNAVTVMLAKVKKTMVTCPDGSSCPGKETCCKLAGGGYGCCPFPEAVCCSDGKHCCPHGTTCDLSSGTCMRGTGVNAVTVMLAKVKKTMVTCPDHSSCPSGHTCCKLAGGGYGCCPFPEAVCCSDGKHCCPHGTTCDLSSGTCMRGTGNNAVTVMLAKVKKTMVTCPGGSSCPGKETCCKLAGGGYGCCPFPEAVCCSDGKHCCPHGTSCDLSSGTCMRGTGNNAMTVMLAEVKKSMVTCPDHSSCPSGHTCCKLAGGGYGCCPFPEAVCCSDGKHCCPHGTTCDLSSGTCMRGTGVNAVTVMLAKVKKTMVTCPDHSSCPSGHTCCKLAGGGYGCCPFPEAVCCSDGKHCCPHGTTCDLSSGTCMRGTGNNAVTVMLAKVKKTMVTCPDGSSCPGKETCCKLAGGGYGCCPFPEAVCCSDGKHCCPHGTSCDLSSGTCMRGTGNNAMTVMLAEVKKSMVTCPDHSSCPSGHTCCKLAGGGYGCCPFPEAVCCSDGKHCCPHGTTCDLSSGTCMRGTGVNAVTVMLAKVKKTMVTCPDHSSCPSGHTCCKLAGGGYGCCPFPEAVCCSDGKHCCPHGTTCDLSSGTCMRGTGNNAVTVMLAKVKKTMVTCPGGSSCPGKETCCKLAGGGYGCCPFPEAVCCSDGKHCCPHGTSCDLSSGTCMRGTGNNAMTVMLAEVKKSMVTCPDHSSCPSGHTCCKLAGGGYGCCPFPEAVCCSDGKHCCPHGTTCDLSSGTCMRGTGVNAVTVMLAKVKKTMVTCPDHSSCPSGHTCCKLAGGGYGCCPFPEAVCCSDGKHCCPHGTTCDLSSGTCVRGTGNNAVTVMLAKVKKTMVTCPDGSSCPGKETCCKLAGGGYGCCPFPEAVCCSDGKHCCPHGTTCDLSSGTCMRGTGVNAVTVMLAKVKKTMVTCPDHSSCPSGHTCCKLAGGGYGCCPFPEAVCCSDGKHCCPHGTTCDLSSGTCMRGTGNNAVTVMLAKVKKTMVTCPGGSSCPGKETCCKLAGGGYGCCPFPEAVCCSDGKHCCPHGTSCDLSSGTCMRGTGNNAMTVMLAEVKKSMVTCPDHSSCPSGHTCCKLAGGGYGCCPFPEAVCCSDGKHCCPHGTTCDLSSGTCMRGTGVNAVTVMLAKVKKTMVTCPDHSSCPSGHTCCKLAGGGYGCCPFPEAVCCSDGKHCCPHGTTCDLSSGTCMRGTGNNAVTVMLAKVKKTMVTCPDGSSCPGKETCCKLAGGGYGCCPFPEAVCCSDGKHCCPHGTSCDLSSGTCMRGTGNNAMTVMLAEVKKSMVTCPDHSSCPSGHTCCKLAGGGYGCCPFPEAVCCSDGKHCCPHGTTCDLSSGTCMRGTGVNAVTVMLAKVKKTMVTCPDHSSCPSGHTCCKLAGGGYGCCPFPEAVCCSDGKHCCPHGTTCDLSSGTCMRGTGNNAVTVMLAKVKKTMVTCPGGSSCPGKETCCKLAGGGYGCCPFPEAVCCSDGKHCCPHGTSCDLSSGTCMRGTGNNAMTVMLAEVKKSMVTCPDHSSCPSGHTCCKLAGGGYGCCPFPEAVCCSDGKHCCPHGTTCDLSSGTCMRGTGVNAVTVMLAKVKKTMVTCPDHSSCPSGHTCCKLAGGGYGCCPFPEAVCCSDGKHCCPHGTTCDLSSGTCMRGTGNNAVTVMLAKVKKTMVTCPGGSSCPGKETCCKLAGGGYGCCPFPEAVCCSDGKHCCPHGTSCDLSSGTCMRGTGNNAMTVMLAEVKKSMVTCPDHSSCPSGHTCCKLAGGGYGCCPFPEAVCCSDGKHCCPHGTTCDLSSGTCMRGTGVNAVTVMLAKVKKTMVTCPDHSSCPSGHTCCKLAGGGYGCCPFPEAVCCSDGKHCCPHGTTCDLSSGTCMRGTGNNAVTVMLAKVKKTMVTCPGGSSCPGKETCCKLAGGGYGCCPFPEAVCCSDGKHCCPHGTSCDLSSGTCMRGTGNNAMTVMLAEVKKSMVTCPDHSSCPSGHTCCKLAGGGYGCCPFPEAVCCSDGKHCCPHGTTCDLSSGTCMRGTGVNAVTVMLAKVKKTMVTCPDHSSCPSGHTCCKLAGGGYGCCPFSEAVCCNDGMHCCPHGTTCDASGFCVRKMVVAAHDVSLSAMLVTCPDNESTCPDNFTCCPLPDGGYGCCSYKDAKCCADGSHCCPHGTMCDIKNHRCIATEGAYSMKKKIPALKNSFLMGIKCDEHSTCPDGYTCCELSTGGYGCCPYPKAMCCEDKIHCCPHGAMCDIAQQKCKPKISALMRSLTKLENVICPDGISSCPPGCTCCKLSSGDYGCCPMLNAVCCRDGKHCCPEGTTCNLSAQTCISEKYEVIMQRKRKAFRPADAKISSLTSLPTMQERMRSSQPESVVCPGGKSMCPDGSTCCLIDEDKYGCCPKTNAVCCSDKKHCCPSGFRCGASGYCTKGLLKIKAFESISAEEKNLQNWKDIASLDVDDLVCPDKQTVCVEGTSCCRNKDKTSFSCCPIVKAVCCSDHIHCCPNGWLCDVEQGTCRRNDDSNMSSPLLKKIPGKTIKDLSAKKPGYHNIN